MFSKTCRVFTMAMFLGNAATVNAQTTEDRRPLHPNTSVPEVIRPPTATSAGMGEVDIRKMNRLTLVMPMMRGLLGVMPVDHVEGRIAYRKADLAITDAQLPEWDAFAAALRVDAKAMQDAIVRIMNTGGPSTAPARGEAMLELMTTRLEGMRAVVEAERLLYHVLSAEQRQTIDNLMAGPVGAM